MFTATDNFQDIQHVISKNSMSIELLSLFRNRNLWSAETGKAQGTLTFLSHHARPYFSPLRASFLFEFKSLEALTFFSPVLVRDGAMTLLHFFYKNPNPPKNLFLIVQKKLKNLIPSSWRSHVLLYDIQNQCRALNSNKKILFLVSSFGDRQNSLEYTQKILKNIGLLNQDENIEIAICPVSSQNKEIALIQDALTTQYSESIFQIANSFGVSPKLTTVSNLNGKDLSDWLFVDLNEYSFYYSDSFLHHLLCLQGARPYNLETEDPAKTILSVPLSFYHDLKLYLNDSSEYSGQIQNALTEFRNTPILHHEEATHNPEKISFQHKICSPSFEDFAYHWSQTLIR